MPVHVQTYHDIKIENILYYIATLYVQGTHKENEKVKTKMVSLN